MEIFARPFPQANLPPGQTDLLQKFEERYEHARRNGAAKAELDQIIHETYQALKHHIWSG